MVAALPHFRRPMHAMSGRSAAAEFWIIALAKSNEIDEVDGCHLNCTPWVRLSRTPFLDHFAGRHPVSAGSGGPCAADRFASDIGGLLPIALCGLTSL